MKPYTTIILGAGGRDFHNFLTYFKNNPTFKVVAFTASQIPGIEKRSFPKKLAGKSYKKDILIYSENYLPRLIRKFNVDYCFLSYSDLSHQEVMEKASLVLASGANFALLGTKDTMIQPKKPVISITAVRTGCGKSQTSRKVAEILQTIGKKVVAIRHPMPYGNLMKQRCQRFATYPDLKKQHVTIEEREEYEPWIERDIVVYAGVDYEMILRKAEREADVIIWDGGNNDLSFFKSDLNIVVVDSLRSGHELTYYPGFVNFLLADVIVINKIDTAHKKDIDIIKKHVQQYNPHAQLIFAKSHLTVDYPELLRGKNALVVEDGPTLTHGGMSYGAGTVAAHLFKVKRIVDARKYAVGSILDVYKKYSHLQKILPAMGYSAKQISELQQTINKAKCDLVIDGSPVNISRLLRVNKPVINVHYELEDFGTVRLESILKEFIKRKK